MTKTNRERAKSALDEAVRQYIETLTPDLNEDEPDMPHRVIIGWTIGIALTSIDAEGNDYDHHIVESQPGLNNFMATGLADITAEWFKAQALGVVDDDDD